MRYLIYCDYVELPETLYLIVLLLLFQFLFLCCYTFVGIKVYIISTLMESKHACVNHCKVVLSVDIKNTTDWSTHAYCTRQIIVSSAAFDPITFQWSYCSFEGNRKEIYRLARNISSTIVVKLHNIYHRVSHF